jgi:hypothetical protein
VFSITGKKEPSTISSILGSSPIPNHIIIMGIQAIGGIGLKISRKLPRVAFK